MKTKFYNNLNQGTQSLVDWQYHDCGDFGTALWKAISQADQSNLARLALAYPEHIEAYLFYTRAKGWWQKVQEGLGYAHTRNNG